MTTASQPCTCATGWKGQRAALAEELGEDLPRPVVKALEETEDSEAQKAVNELVVALVADLPESPADMSGDQRGQWMLAQPAELASAGEQVLLVALLPSCHGSPMRNAARRPTHWAS